MMVVYKKPQHLKNKQSFKLLTKSQAKNGCAISKQRLINHLFERKTLMETTTTIYAITIFTKSLNYSHKKYIDIPLHAF